LDHIIASASDDNDVGIIDHNKLEYKVLKKHNNKVRALCFSNMFPHILLSGDWDGHIIVWDFLKEQR